MGTPISVSTGGPVGLGLGEFVGKGDVGDAEGCCVGFFEGDSLGLDVGPGDG